MSDISATATLVVNKNGASLAKSISAGFDMTGDDMGGQTQLIGTSDEILPFPSDITTVRFLLVINLDPTNYVQLSYTSGGGFASFARIDPGGFFFGRPESLTIYAKANTAACRVDWGITET